MYVTLVNSYLFPPDIAVNSGDMPLPSIPGGQTFTLLTAIILGAPQEPHSSKIVPLSTTIILYMITVKNNEMQ